MPKKNEDELETLVEASEEKREMADSILAEESEFKGNPMLILRSTPEDKYPLQIGLTKARKILQHVKNIQAFVDKHEK